MNDSMELNRILLLLAWVFRMRAVPLTKMGNAERGKV